MSINRRQILKWSALAPALPQFLVNSAFALDEAPAYEGNILVVVRLKGGNDGLNAVVPIQNDLYFKGRPSIAIKKQDTLALKGGDLGLNPALADFQWLMDQGLAGIVQNVGYANSSRSHTRGTEIFEVGTTADQAPMQGWLGRYLDQVPGTTSLSGVEFGEELGRTLASGTRRSRSITNPHLLLGMENAPVADRPSRVSATLDQLRMVQNDLSDTSRQLLKASKGTGSSFGYPDTTFGQSLRWTGDMIEKGGPTRLYYVTLGSFDTPYSFDTHTDELAIHKVLYSEFGKGLRAFSEHLRKSGHLQRVQLLTFSDFGRQIFENREGGTDHGDAGLMFLMGGKMRAGLHGDLPDIASANDGGLPAKVDFRQVYADVLTNWLKVDSQKILGERVDNYSVIA
ncbi:MAG: DUF1501 domain-containing protein [Bryobacteraceae bacterium]